MNTPILYELAIENGDSEIAIPLTLSHRHLLLMAMANVRDNPAIYIKDYADYTQDDVDTFLDQIIERLMANLIIQPETGFQTRWDLWAIDAIRGINDAGSSTMFLTYDGTQTFWHYYRQNPGVLNDQVHFTCYMGAGQYTMRWHGIKNNISGRLSIIVWKMFGDGSYITPIANAELYNATPIFNQFITQNFTLTEGGEYKIVLSIGAKHASSSGYQHNWTKLSMWRWDNV